MTIAKAINIVNDGVGVAAIGAGSGNAITINAGPSDSVHLRGLTIAGLSSGTNGIQFNTGGNLAIENCVIRNFVNFGIEIEPSTSSSFSVSNTIASNNSGTGIIVQPTGSAVVTGVLSEVTADNNAGGIVVNGSALGSLNVTVVDSVVSTNSIVGVDAVAGFAPTAVMVRNSVASNNGTGLVAEVNAVLRVAHSVVTGNATGVKTSGGGSIQSYGDNDNDIDGNTTNNFGALTPIPTH